MYFYGNARTALYYGLKKFNIRPGDKILIPSVICSSVLEPIKFLGLTMINYHVNSDFNLDVDKVSLQISYSKPDVFMYVNFFCFGEIPEEITFLCKKLNILCVIDNSHCFYENYYNFRTSLNYGFIIYSIRKILPLHKGGLLVTNNQTQLQNHSQIASIDIKNFMKYILKLRFRRLINRLKFFSKHNYYSKTHQTKSFSPSYIDKVSVEKFYQIDMKYVSTHRNSCWEEWSKIFSDFENEFNIIPKIDSAHKIPWSIALHNKSLKAQEELLYILLKAGVTAFIWPDIIQNNNSYLCIVLDSMPKASIKQNLLKLKNHS
jgi:hypothetical protein